MVHTFESGPEFENIGVRHVSYGAVPSMASLEIEAPSSTNLEEENAICIVSRASAIVALLLSGAIVINVLWATHQIVPLPQEASIGAANAILETSTRNCTMEECNGGASTCLERPVYWCGDEEKQHVYGKRCSTRPFATAPWDAWYCSDSCLIEGGGCNHLSRSQAMHCKGLTCPSDLCGTIVHRLCIISNARYHCLEGTAASTCHGNEAHWRNSSSTICSRCCDFDSCPSEVAGTSELTQE